MIDRNRDFLHKIKKKKIYFKRNVHLYQIIVLMKIIRWFIHVSEITLLNIHEFVKKLLQPANEISFTRCGWTHILFRASLKKCAYILYYATRFRQFRPRCRSYFVKCTLYLRCLESIKLLIVDIYAHWLCVYVCQY